MSALQRESLIAEYITLTGQLKAYPRLIGCAEAMQESFNIYCDTYDIFTLQSLCVQLKKLLGDIRCKGYADAKLEYLKEQTCKRTGDTYWILNCTGLSHGFGDTKKQETKQ